MAKASKKSASKESVTARKKALATPVRPAPGKAAASSKKAVPQKSAIKAPKLVLGGPVLKKTAKQVLYIDSSLFFPDNSGIGYADEYQEGRYTLEPNRLLQAPILLPVGAKIKTLTIYYKNTTTESMPVAILKKHITHHAPSGEFEVSLDDCPPGILPPDDFLSKLINHFDNAGVIRDNYLYFIQIFNTAKIDDTQKRLLRGIRIELQL